MKIANRIRIRQYARQAEGYLELGMPQAALDALARLDKLGRLNVQGLYLKGEALRMMERYEEALVPLGQAALVAPRNIPVWLAIGWCQKRAGRIDLAARAMEHALDIQPNEALVHYNLACYLSLAGDRRQALDHLSEALKIDPEYRALVDGEPDFDPIRSDPEFRALTSVIV